MEDGFGLVHLGQGEGHLAYVGAERFRFQYLHCCSKAKKPACHIVEIFEIERYLDAVVAFALLFDLGRDALARPAVDIRGLA